LLLCTDLDRTLLPNGVAPESPRARPLFARLAADADVTLVYVTGRDAGLVDEALATWKVPVPDVLIGDVGTTIAERRDGAWVRWPAWDEAIARDWSGRGGDAIRDLLQGIEGLEPQDDSRQGPWKVSWETAPGVDVSPLVAEVRRRLDAAGVRASVIWSVGEPVGVGLVDVLPAAANKERAIAYVMRRLGFGADEVVFAGDSGNDLDVLVGPIPAVLVANASPELRATARREADAAGHGAALHLARGGVMGMNGNYAAGILEGVLHYHPEWARRLEVRS
jgi:HAD superfamily hydrolase (TIGR01484 family)